jgi:hypothetical protein
MKQSTQTTEDASVSFFIISIKKRMIGTNSTYAEGEAYICDLHNLFKYQRTYDKLENLDKGILLDSNINEK